MATFLADGKKAGDFCFKTKLYLIAKLPKGAKGGKKRLFKEKG